MTEDKRTTYIEEIPKADYVHEKAVKAFRYWVAVHTKHGGYMADEIDIYIFADGTVCVSNDSAFMSLDAGQVEFLKGVLK